uniref:Putative salivary secreted Tyr rich peptide n=1 Tax=Oncopeltus fasciatus TaxID=7536 RepID=A3FK34_ONCFA|nr:putative salivary secreted Tyr rich peptide [Oncopeltus fasciatus]
MLVIKLFFAVLFALVGMSMAEPKPILSAIADGYYGRRGYYDYPRRYYRRGYYEPAPRYYEEPAPAPVREAPAPSQGIVVQQVQNTNAQ